VSACGRFVRERAFFLNPQGVVKRREFLRRWAIPSAPGEFCGVVGSNSRRPSRAPPPPYHNSGGRVCVTVLINGVASPIYFVSSGADQRSSALRNHRSHGEHVVTNHGTLSNTAFKQVPVAAGRRGRVYGRLNGIGSGRDSSSRRIITLVAFLQNLPQTRRTVLISNGLGAVNPLVPDGTAGLASPLSRAAARSTG